MQALEDQATISDLRGRRDAALDDSTALSTSRADAVAQRMATERLAKELRAAKEENARAAKEAEKGGYKFPSSRDAKRRVLKSVREEATKVLRV